MWRDVTVAARSLFKRPGFAAAAIATLAVGIGATTAIFSTVNAALLRPLPYQNPEDLYALGTALADGRFSTGLIAPVEAFALNERATSVVRAAIHRRLDSALVGGSSSGENGETEGQQVVLYGVSEGFFELFGLPLAVGQGFTREDHVALVVDALPPPPAPGTPGVIRRPPPLRLVLSHRIWQERFGGDPNIVGVTLDTANGPAIVSGVAARDFNMPPGADGWTNIRTAPRGVAHSFDGYLRARPGTTRDQMMSELDAVMRGVAEEFPAAASGRVYTTSPLADSIVGDLKPILLLVLGGAGLLLLLSCVNVTNLLLARGTVRTRDFAVRTALGAGRGHLIRQLLTESLVLAAFGTLAGLFLAYGGVRLLLYLGASQLPRLADVPFDARVLLFAFVVLIVTGVFIGLAPAIRFARVDLRSLLNEGTRSATSGRGTHRLLSSMIVAEIAIAMVLVAGAGWLAQSFGNLSRTDPGFTAEGRLVFDLFRRFTPGTPPPQMQAENMRWQTELPERLLSISGVTSVGSTSTVPLRGERNVAVYVGTPEAANDPNRQLTARSRAAGPGFFRTMGVRMVAGREFEANERFQQPTAIVNQAFVRRYLPDKDPLTSHFFQGFPTVTWKQPVAILGVVADMQYDAVGEAAEPTFYIPMGVPAGTIVLDTNVADPLALTSSIRAAVHSLDPTIPVNVQAMEDVVALALARQRLGMTLMLIFAASALALAAIGIYGVIAYVSAQRSGEVATRMALGATPAAIFWMLMKHGRTLGVIGVVLGIGAAYAVGRVVTSRLYQVEAHDPLILALAVLCIAGITAAAVAIPARRASQIDLANTLRLE